MPRGLVVLLAVAALAAAASATTTATAAVRVVGGAAVDCVDPGAWTSITTDAGLRGAHGLYDVRTGQISLPAPSCDLLDALGRGYAPHAQLRAYELADAVFVLGHELRHAAGVADEHQADCGAARGFVPLAQRLGASRAYALELLTYVPLGSCS